jgi:hypothetical protein
MSSFNDRVKKLTPQQKKCFRQIERLLKNPVNVATERALCLARDACLGETMWKGVQP